MTGTRYNGYKERYAPMLEASYDETADLIDAFRNGDEDAGTKLIEGHYWVIRKVLRDHKIDFKMPAWDDLFAFGKTGLIKAAFSYDRDNKEHMPFYTFAMLPVWHDIFKGFKEGLPFSLSKGDNEKLSKIRKYNKAFETTHGRLPEVGETAYALSLKDKEVEILMDFDKVSMCSLDAPISDDNAHTVSEVVPDGRESVEQTSERSDRNEMVRYCVEHVLDATERIIISGNFGLDGDVQTLAEIADSMGLKLDKVKSIRAKAMSKLKKALDDYER